jgi:hypothetical protein
VPTRTARFASRSAASSRSFCSAIFTAEEQVERRRRALVDVEQRARGLFRIAGLRAIDLRGVDRPREYAAYFGRGRRSLM